MRKLILLVIAAVVLFTANAYADETNWNGIRITDSSKNILTSFSNSTIPYVWLRKDTKKDDPFAGWWKFDLGNFTANYNDTKPAAYDYFAPLTDWGWTPDLAGGNYTVHAGGYGTERFSWAPSGGPVVPEPISSALFILGGGTLIARKLRKKK